MSLAAGGPGRKSTRSASREPLVVQALDHNNVLPPHIGGIKFNVLFSVRPGYDVWVPIEKIALIRQAPLAILIAVLGAVELTPEL